MRTALVLAMLLGGGCRGPEPAGPFRSELRLFQIPADLGAAGTAGATVVSNDPATPGVLLLPDSTTGRAVLVSGVIGVPDLSFDQALVSWNVAVPHGSGARLDIRVGRQTPGGIAWSAFLFVSDWGQCPIADPKVLAFTELVPDDGGAPAPATGKIDTDFFTSKEAFQFIQYRVTAAGTPSAIVRLERVALTLTDRKVALGGPEIDACGTGCADGLDQAASGSPVAITVPFRTQRNVAKDMASRLCSPTSVSMVMAYRGVDVPLEKLAAVVYDRPHDIYGNWPRNIQGAFSMGVPGYLRRYSDWSQVLATFQEGTPIIASIKVRPGELRGAPYQHSAGHLIVLRGFDKDGSVLVNDPAAKTPEKGMVRYRREDLERVWLRRCAGTAYVLLPKASAGG